MIVVLAVWMRSSGVGSVDAQLWCCQGGYVNHWYFQDGCAVVISTSDSDNDKFYIMRSSL